MDAQDQELQWAKIKTVLEFSKITDPVGIESLRKHYDRMDLQFRGNILEKGQSAAFSRSTELKNHRDLFRAYNFLSAIRGMQAGTGYRPDEVLKGRAHSGEAKLTELQQTVARLYAEVRTHEKVTQGVAKPPEQVASGTILAPVSPPTPVSPETKRLEQGIGLRGWTRIRAAVPDVARRHQATLLKRMGAAGIQHADHEFYADLTSDWTRARADLQSHFSNHILKFITGFASPLRSGVTLAYEKFNHAVQANQQRLAGRIDLAKKCFEALSSGPFPISLLGKIGGGVAGAVKADEYDPVKKYQAVKGEGGSAFIKAIGEKMEALEEALTIGKVPPIPFKEDILHALNDATEAYRKKLTEIAEGVLDIYLPTDPAAKRAKLEGVIATYVGQQGRLREGDIQKHQMELIKTAMRHFTEETKRKIDSVFALPTTTRSSDLTEAVAMWLFCQFVAGYWKDGFKLDLADEVVAFFEQPGDWGVIRRNVTHADAIAVDRLSWKGNEDHKRVLHLFCGWYVAEVNPFHLLTGVQRDGQPFTGALIKQMIRKEVGHINDAIGAGREKGFFGSTWNWSTIYAFHSVRPF